MYAKNLQNLSGTASLKANVPIYLRDSMRFCYFLDVNAFLESFIVGAIMHFYLWCSVTVLMFSCSHHSLYLMELFSAKFSVRYLLRYRTHRINLLGSHAHPSYFSPATPDRLLVMGFRGAHGPFSGVTQAH